MSADNEIAILQCADQFRVTHASTSHLWTLTCDMNPPTKKQRQILSEAFADAKTFATEDEATDEAFRIENETGYVEYGVTFYRTSLTWAEIDSGA